ncbi:MAG TPA: acyloxyacyl hydrolase, partial [Hyphomicrobiaceae bacterium]|nr:acyloxyacyl hydrolase [Hyphomicrobiaceae bacterium]
SAPTFAADLYGYRGSVKDGPVPVMQHRAAGPCYFRGDVGYSMSGTPDVSWPVNSITRTYDGTDANNPGNQTGFATTYLGDAVSNVQIQDSWLGEVGIGCGSGSRGFRAEFALGYRGKRKIDGEPHDFSVTNNYTGSATTVNTPVIDDPLHTSLTSYTMMFNVYKDLGQWGRVVPYVGAGIGLAYHQMDEVYFTNNQYLVNRIEGNSDLSFAWALMAGFGYQISDRAIVDVGYRYINMGKATSGRVDSAGFANPVVTVDDIAAHEFKVGLRYHFGSSGGCCSGGNR